MNPEIDTFGYCAYCHEPNIERIAFQMTNGTAMHVSLCLSCQAGVIDDERLMKSIIKGWEREVKELVASGKWTHEKADNYMKEYSQLKILRKEG